MNRSLVNKTLWMSKSHARRPMYSALSRRQLGLTGVELIVAVGIIAILIGLLLPAMQDQRVELNRAAALLDAQALGTQARSFQIRNGRAALSLSELVSECEAQSSCPIPEEIRDGVHNGYLYFFHNKNRVVEAWPGVPGLTGIDTLVVNGGRSASDLNRSVNVGKLSVVLLNGVGSIATPGAEENYLQAVDQTHTRLFEVMGEMLAQDSQTTSAIRFGGFGDPQDILTSIDVDGDGRISVTEMIEPTTSSYKVDFTDIIISNFALGSHGENLEVLGYSFGATQAGMSHALARQATALFVESPAEIDPLHDLLDASNQFELAGDIVGSDMKRAKFNKRLSAGVGAWITRNHAENLRWILNATGIH